jgi:hypothetical protein
MIPVRRVLVGLLLSIIVVLMFLMPHDPGLDTPATSPDPLTYSSEGP